MGKDWTFGRATKLFFFSFFSFFLILNLFFFFLFFGKSPIILFLAQAINK